MTTITGVKYQKCGKCDKDALVLPENYGLCLTCLWANGPVTVLNPVDRALRFGMKVHEGQVRKYTGEPYMVHPIEVANLVEIADGTMAMQAAALLHDTVEDTDTTIGELGKLFGMEIAILVNELTDVSKPIDGNRAIRKEIDRHHIAQASPKGQTIKLADLISNCRDITRHDPTFAKVYMKEMAALLEVLTGGDALLHEGASALVSRYNGKEPDMDSRSLQLLEGKGNAWR